MAIAAVPLPTSSITVETDDPDVVNDNGSNGVVVRMDDGSVVVDLSPPKDDTKSKKFDSNLALDMGTDGLRSLAETLLEGINADLQSRTEWEATRTRGIELLGLKIEEPRSDLGSSSAPLEGMSTVRDSTLLDAVLRGQSNAIGELLPADGPVKIKNIGQENTATDQQADDLEEEFNHYLTDIATEYYPDTKRMLFWTYFGGSGWKKVYSCPIRRRPVSESIDANDLIVSNAATDLWNAGRVTHRITMRPSVMKRMQFLGVYRDVNLGQPTADANRVKDKQDSVEGIKPVSIRPEDQPYTLYECYCEWDLDEYAPKQFKGKSIPLPYRVTIDKDSREILEIHRNWKEDDEACLPRKYFVRYPYVEGMGIYGIGLVHILGNATIALTAAEREMLDTGMFANFPGYVYLKQLGRQLTNEFRIPPGGGVGLDVPSGRIGDGIMPLPYKDVSGGLMALWDKLKADAQRLGGTADLPIGEGVQNTPVGTILAVIEQATKVESAVHKGLHHAQSEEFQLLKERFEEDPEAFWRHNPSNQTAWTEEKFLAALKNSQLVPVADPNTPSHMHRIAKGMVIKQLQQANPGLYNARAVDERVLAMARVDDAADLFAPAPTGPPPPDPNMIAAQAKLITAQTGQAKVQADGQNKQAELANDAAQRQADETAETAKLAQAMIVHAGNQKNADRQHVLAATDSAHNRLMDLHEAMQPPEPPATGKARGGAVGDAGPRKAKDGKWYLPDPHRAGKYLRVDQV